MIAQWGLLRSKDRIENCSCGWLISCRAKQLLEGSHDMAVWIGKWEEGSSTRSCRKMRRCWRGSNLSMQPTLLMIGTVTMPRPCATGTDLVNSGLDLRQECLSLSHLLLSIQLMATTTTTRFRLARRSPFSGKGQSHKACKNVQTKDNRVLYNKLLGLTPIAQFTWSKYCLWLRKATDSL